MSSTIESVLTESRVFPPSPDFVRQANVPGMEAYHAMCAEAERDFEGFWAKHARAELLWKKPFTKTLDESHAPFYKWFHDGELNASYNCLDRHLATQPDKIAIIFEADDGTVTTHHLQGSLSRGMPLRERAEGEGHQGGRSRARVHADVDPGGRRDAGLRPHRRHALGRVRRVFREEHSGADHRRGRGRRHHRRRPVSRRARDRAEAGGRRGARDGRLRGHQVRVRVEAHRFRGPDEGGSRLLVARRRREGARHMRTGVGQCRASALHPLHLGIDREAEGRPALDGRLPAAGDPDDEVDVRLQAHRRVLVHGRRGLGHRPHLHCLRAARVRGDRNHLRRRADLPRRRPLLEDDPGSQGHGVLHGADGDPLADQGRRRPARPSTICRGCEFSAPSASRSIRKRGCGTTRPSAARAVRSSTRGGKRKPAAI